MPSDRDPAAAAAPPPASNDPDAHGQAALLLVESLIHGLIGASLLTVRQAIEVVDTAVEVEDDLTDTMDEAGQTRRRSLALLGAISASLSRELGE